MANDFFRFKNFKVYQDQCAMKVSTDSCLFGAWVPFPENVKTILDIGAGTGLLSLMMAQRFPEARITSIELDPNAAEQAAENVRNSPFADRIVVENQDIRKYQSWSSFDAIICNPPFFQNSLKGPDSLRNQARHTDEMPFPELVQIAETLLSNTGLFAVLLPAREQQNFDNLAAVVNLNALTQLRCRPLPDKPVNRIFTCYQKSFKGHLQVDDMILYEAYGTFTPKATQLLQPFYLHL